MKRATWYAIGLLLSAGLAHTATVLYAIGPDSYAVGRRLVSVSPSDMSASWLGDVGTDSSRAVNGGLAYNAADKQLYGISNDSNGAGKLISFGTGVGDAYFPADIMTLDDVTWNGGLAVGGDGNFYGLGVGWDGAAYTPGLWKIVVSGSVTRIASLDTSLGWMGGLTWDPAGSFYALASENLFDGEGNWLGADTLLQRISSSGGTVTTALTIPAGGYTGGLAYASPGSFYAIRNDWSDSGPLSYLVQILLSSGGSATDISPMPWNVGNWGYWNAGLTLADSGGGTQEGGVPEPGTMALVGMALAGIATRWKAHSKPGAQGIS
jgi:hypothetical protein